MPRQRANELFAPVPDWLSMPFHYGTLTCLRVYYEVDAERAQRVLAPVQMAPFIWDGRAYASLDFQLYSAHTGSFLARTAEVELCLLGAPERRVAPEMPLDDFLQGEDQSRTVGYYRLHVPCDNEFAVKAGRALFGENKYLASFEWSEPSPNAPAAGGWSYTCSDTAGRAVFSLRAGLQGSAPRRTSTASIVRYATLEGRLAGSRWDLDGILETHLTLPRGAVEVSAGPGELPILEDLRWTALAGKPCAAQTFSHRSAAIEGRAFYVDAL